MTDTDWIAVALEDRAEWLEWADAAAAEGRDADAARFRSHAAHKLAQAVRHGHVV